MHYSSNSSSLAIQREKWVDISLLEKSLMKTGSVLIKLKREKEIWKKQSSSSKLMPLGMYGFQIMASIIANKWRSS